MAKRNQHSRRRFLAGGIGGVVAAGLATGAGATLLGRHASNVHIQGTLNGANWRVGHRLRADIPAASPVSVVETDIAIIGGGAAGLSAGWKLRRSGFDNFQLFDLENAAGGNARGGVNAISAYPWGAHYVPIASMESKPLIELFTELNIVTGYDAQGLPIYDTLQICSDPQERLFIHGRWQEDIVPALGVPENERQQMKQFFDLTEKLRLARGADGKPLFAIPIEASSRDPQWLALDQQTIKDYLLTQGWDSPHLHWYVNYCCRDDYGTQYEEVSAWAGLHYFAARRGKAANVDPGAVVTWPQGNAYLTDHLASTIQDRIRTNLLATRVTRTAEGVEIDLFDTVTSEPRRLRAKAVILSVPQFVTQHIAPFLSEGDIPHGFSYAPWMVAAISLDRHPAGPGVALAWDNVSYTGKSLGYVVATHQNLNMLQEETVISLYWPLSDLPPSEARRLAIGRSYDAWRDLIVEELEAMHPGIRDHILNLDIWLWGHAMIRPVPGFIWGEARQRAAAPQPPIFRAHSDLSGISIFEEAQYRGVAAAEQAMAFLQHDFRSSL